MEPIYECNVCCSCPSTCINRLVQKTPKWNLITFQTEQKGIGLKTTHFIPRGSFVIEYIGEIISSHEAFERTSKLTDMDSSYMFTLKEHFGSNSYKFHVDATHTGNFARFINHSCEPNLFIVPVRVNSVIPLLALFSLGDISISDELTFDYGRDINSQCTIENISLCQEELCKKRCMCGSNKCRGFLPYDKNMFL